MKFFRYGFCCCVTIFLFYSCDKKTVREAPAENNSVPAKPVVVDIKTFQQDDGWGYDIYVDGVQYIHQPNIPAVNGLHTFKTEHDAQLVATAVAQKIQNNIMPPTITIEEMKSMGIVLE